MKYGNKLGITALPILKIVNVIIQKRKNTCFRECYIYIWCVIDFRWCYPHCSSFFQVPMFPLFQIFQPCVVPFPFRANRGSHVGWTIVRLLARLGYNHPLDGWSSFTFFVPEAPWSLKYRYIAPNSAGDARRWRHLCHDLIAPPHGCRGCASAWRFIVLAYCLIMACSHPASLGKSKPWLWTYVSAKAHVRSFLTYWKPHPDVTAWKCA